MWIAFIFQYLWDTKQPLNTWLIWTFRCELLSFFSIFGIQNNATSNVPKRSVVVNCFHFSVSLGYKTTHTWGLISPFWLWIAFIFQYLWDTKQQYNKIFKGFASCELLSFFSIFGIQNNNLEQKPKKFSVVNCFHFSVSLGYKTTLL